MRPHDKSPNIGGRELEAALNRLDLATETLEGLDELGVATRDELVSLMDTLEAEINDDAESSS